MILLHFIRRDFFELLLNNDYYLCSSEKILEDTIRKLKEEYGITEITEEMFKVARLPDVETVRKIKFLTIDKNAKGETRCG